MIAVQAQGAPMPEYVNENPDFSEYAAANRDAMYRMVTGSSPDDLREQVRALGGTRAAARIAGVTQRTVQRWITRAGQQRISTPRAASRQAVQGAFDQARSTEDGRRQIAEGRRQTLMRHHGAHMEGRGEGGPLTPSRDKNYLKWRRFTGYHVDGGTMDFTFDAWISGGDDAAFFAFNQAFGDEYGRGGAFDEWMFSDMGELRFGPDMTD
jgi:hypothetical protein